MTQQISPIWNDAAKEDLKRIYEFNKNIFSVEFARKINNEIYDAVGNISYLNQWQKDEILGEPYRRIIVRHYKIVYRVKDEQRIYILLIFDARQNPSKYKV
ncbi:MAG TPA: type II toxin-antitoxin system RelE/ParE family toxin [Moheibacter sp.]|nr:type II toxin-antitoxin system RelE/ParE family toxin [Moheibacter sp.]